MWVLMAFKRDEESVRSGSPRANCKEWPSAPLALSKLNGGAAPRFLTFWAAGRFVDGRFSPGIPVSLHRNGTVNARLASDVFWEAWVLRSPLRAGNCASTWRCRRFWDSMVFGLGEEARMSVEGSGIDL